MTPTFLTKFVITWRLSCPPHLTNVSTLPCKTRKTHRTSFVAVHYTLFHTGCGWKRLRACAAAEGGQFEHELWLVVKQYCCNCAFWLCHLIVWLLIKFAVTVFSVLWLFQSHAAVMKHYNAFCVKLTANSDIEQNNISKSTFPVRVSEYFHI